MALPFDRPPSPTQADANAETLYASIGRALSGWESIESELSHIYALLIGKMWQHEAYDQYYEQGKSGQARITTLAKAGEQYFIKKPDQTVEGQFSLLIRRVGHDVPSFDPYTWRTDGKLTIYFITRAPIALMRSLF